MWPAVSAFVSFLGLRSFAVSLPSVHGRPASQRRAGRLGSPWQQVVELGQGRSRYARFMWVQRHPVNATIAVAFRMVIIF